ncbi:hypothetical protein COCC4DRAFT_155114 [Bipolaris maydis ATCC 48331]|uniref:Uncharacterized protein n=2 Tax=Cochliobolus heterostrophus TaxID=5016 RepID=M2U5Q5_COCH5|nr:uncharacterized protein COCC4DRAFT_155114 [Bipolaris maydis ATCC 48331]EMD93859.1 hypothetical protein COCHEDRAFT_1095175 [Bipolaris maydis C5]KAJ5028319.1 hypothetical protein J3E73DRAFT_256222 [Bipolaris maydis]ENH98720.1 hypothetical protein COCC4DRAFT_155114 [Bipolaris maydis ATCC 48331]KAJ5041964.1 hypothetical protein J3E74DRAFT_296395 [Bipolaris maydis]KAJ5063096.1 hypothetical protein J3E74DRAFT_288758 [Bipolaris maydis]
MHLVPLIAFASIFIRCSGQLILGTIALIELTIEFMEFEAVVATAEISIEGPIVAATEEGVADGVILQTDMDVGGSYTVRAGHPGAVGSRQVSGSLDLAPLRRTDTVVNGQVNLNLRSLRVNDNTITPRVQVSVPFKSSITFGPGHGPGSSASVGFSMQDAVVNGVGRFGIGRNSDLVWRISSSTGRFHASS